MELLVVIAIILIILTVAIPQYRKQIMLSHETAAIRAIGTIKIAEAQYMTDFGQFAPTLVQLGPPPSGGPGPAAADLISGDLASGKKSGYNFVVAARAAGYSIGATPEEFNRSGRFTYYSDETLTIRRNSAQEVATAESPQIQ